MKWALADTVRADIRTPDAIIAALRHGEMNVTALAKATGRGRGAIKRALGPLKVAGKVVHTGRGTYASAGTRPPYIPTCDAIITALADGEMSSAALAKATGKGKWSVQHALRRHLIPRGTVILTSRCTYALAGTRPAYVPTADAIIAALADGEKSFAAMVAASGKTTSAVAMSLYHLQEQSVVVKVRLGVYRLTRRTRARRKENAARQRARR